MTRHGIPDPLGLWLAMLAPWLPPSRRASCEDIGRGCGGKQAAVKMYAARDDRAVPERDLDCDPGCHSGGSYAEVPAVMHVPQPHPRLRLVGGRDV